MFYMVYLTHGYELVARVLGSGQESWAIAEAERKHRSYGRNWRMWRVLFEDGIGTSEVARWTAEEHKGYAGESFLQGGA